MKIRLYSDLHLEMRRDDGKKLVESFPDFDGILILAGDITSGDLLHKTMGWFSAKCNKVIYVSGNHSYYGVTLKDMNADIKKVKKDYSNVHMLDCEMVEIDGQRFLGTTLWYPKPAKHPLEPGMIWSDFKWIPGADPWIYEQNKKAVKFLNKEMKKDDIVITHMLPSYNCVAPQYLLEKTNCYYVCDIHDLIVEREPKLFAHGHTHIAETNLIGKTQVICNPLGYDFAGERSGFNPDMEIEL